MLSSSDYRFPWQAVRLAIDSGQPQQNLSARFDYRQLQDSYVALFAL